MKHGVPKPEKVNQDDCCSAQAFSHKKINDFSVAAQFQVLISAAMST